MCTNGIHDTIFLKIGYDSWPIVLEFVCINGIHDTKGLRFRADFAMICTFRGDRFSHIQNGNSTTKMRTAVRETIASQQQWVPN